MQKFESKNGKKFMKKEEKNHQSKVINTISYDEDFPIKGRKLKTDKKKTKRLSNFEESKEPHQYAKKMKGKRDRDSIRFVKDEQEDANILLEEDYNECCAM